MRINKFFIILLSVFFLGFCKEKKKAYPEKLELPPSIEEAGRYIRFPENSPQLQLFKTEKVIYLDYDISISAPATIMAKVVRAGSASNPPIILFATKELSTAYANYIQDAKQIAFARANYNRTKDLYDNGAATGKELNDASSELYNKQALLAEHEAELRKEGFTAQEIYKAKQGSVYLISDLPETELNVLQSGIACNVTFPGYPGESFEGKIESIAEVLNLETRKARIRILMFDKTNKLKPGMYGKVELILKDNGLMIPKMALFSANARYYVFVKKDVHTFERREVLLSSEKEGLIEIAKGVEEGEEVVVSNVFLLKGLSFGL